MADARTRFMGNGTLGSGVEQNAMQILLNINTLTAPFSLLPRRLRQSGRRTSRASGLARTVRTHITRLCGTLFVEE